MENSGVWKVKDVLGISFVSGNEGQVFVGHSQRIAEVGCVREKILPECVNINLGR